MVLSRSLAYLVRNASITKTSVQKLSTSVPKQSSGQWNYRQSSAPSRITFIKAETFGGIMWFWMLYHIYHEPEHLLGDFPYPDATKWTDEELGITDPQ